MLAPAVFNLLDLYIPGLYIKRSVTVAIDTAAGHKTGGDALTTSLVNNSLVSPSSIHIGLSLLAMSWGYLFMFLAWVNNCLVFPSFNQ